MRKLFCLFFILISFPNLSFSLTINVTTTPCSSHGCEDGKIYVAGFSLCGHYSMQRYPDPLVILNSSTPFQILGGSAGTYSFTFYEECGLQESQTITVIITEPPCNTTLTIDTVIVNSYMPGCPNGSITITGNTPSCYGYSPYRARLYKNGVLKSSQTQISGSPVDFANLDSGWYAVSVTNYQIICCYLNSFCTDSVLIQITAPDCSFSIAMDSIKNPQSGCTNGEIFISGNNAINCGGGATSFSLKLYKNGVLISTDNVPISANGHFHYTNLDTGLYYIVGTNIKCKDTSMIINLTAPPCATIVIDSIIRPCSTGSLTGKIYVTTKILGSSCVDGDYSYRLLKNGVMIRSGNSTDTSLVTHIFFSGLDVGTYKIEIIRSFCGIVSPDIFVNSYMLGASLSSDISTCKDAPSPNLTFMGFYGQPPYTFTYKINGAILQTISTLTGNSAISLPVPTNNEGTYVYQIVSVADPNCNVAVTVSDTVHVRPLPSVDVYAIADSICQFSLDTPIIVFSGSEGTYPPYSYTFNYDLYEDLDLLGTYTINNSPGKNFGHVNVPTNESHMYKYELNYISDTYCTSYLTKSDSTFVKPAAQASAYDVIGCNGDAIALAGFPQSENGQYNVPNPYTGPSGSYYYTYSNAYGCSDTAYGYIYHYFVCNTYSITQRTLCLKFFVEGYYSGARKMIPSLMSQGLNISNTIADSVEIQLRDTTSGFGVIESIRTVVKTDGTTCWFLPLSPIITGHYYIVVKLRNGIETWSRNPVYISATPIYYDFTSPH